MAVGFSAVGELCKIYLINALENFSHLSSMETAMSLVQE
jgi:hypothetical protein